jgi:aromatic ring-opening dioxygenase catalytic subunit (LigB family)
MPNSISIQPSLYIPHGGGPCFFMDDPHGLWVSMEAYLRSIPATLPALPKAILVISAHWETDGFCLTGAAHPSLVYDYYNFPPHTYKLRYDAPGAPDLARTIVTLLSEAGFQANVDPDRGLDHGVFVPLKVAFPEAEIPVVEMSLDKSLDPALHLAAGRALLPLRSRGILIIGSGMSFHNMRAFGDKHATAPSREFDNWLTDAALASAETRAENLKRWSDAPSGLFLHPREEHLLPLMVAAGASSAPGERQFSDIVLETAISGYSFA